jgi:hypothetical protein
MGAPENRPNAKQRKANTCHAVGNREANKTDANTAAFRDTVPDI